MGWKGAAIGGYVGSLFGGPLGTIIGAVLGHNVEKGMKSGSPAEHRQSRGTENLGAVPPHRRSQIFCASAAAMLAKLAKADGRVTPDEISSVESAFARLRFSQEARALAIDAFRKAKDDRYSIYEYADNFASAVDSVDVRELFYELLWDLACADGSVSPEELQILKRMPRALRIRADWFDFFASRKNVGGTSNVGRDELAEAYTTLGARATDTADDLKRKYRELAKRNHPDALRAQGLPDEMVDRATARMSRINDAWAKIRSAREI